MDVCAVVMIRRYFVCKVWHQLTKENSPFVSSYFILLHKSANNNRYTTPVFMNVPYWRSLNTLMRNLCLILNDSQNLRQPWRSLSTLVSAYKNQDIMQ